MKLKTEHLGHMFATGKGMYVQLYCLTPDAPERRTLVHLTGWSTDTGRLSVPLWAGRDADWAFDEEGQGYYIDHADVHAGRNPDAKSWGSFRGPWLMAHKVEGLRLLPDGEVEVPVTVILP